MFATFSFLPLTICFAIPLLMFLLQSSFLHQQMMPSSKEPTGIWHLLRRNYFCGTIGLVISASLMFSHCCRNNVSLKWDWRTRNASSPQSTTSVPILTHHCVLLVSFPSKSVKHLLLIPLESPSQPVVQVTIFSSLDSEFPLIFTLPLPVVDYWILLAVSQSTSNIQVDPSSLTLPQSSFMPAIKLEPPQPKLCCPNINSKPSARSMVSLSRNT